MSEVQQCLDRMMAGMNSVLNDEITEEEMIEIELLSPFEAAMIFDSDKTSLVMSRLKDELKLSVNQMVQEKPRGWQIKKSAYSDVLKMIKEIEGEV